MFGLTMLKHKRVLIQVFSDCFLPLKDDLGNVPIAMQTSKFITASILGICRAYEEQQHINERNFDLLVDVIFEEIFRRESVSVQTLTESWLQSSDAEFLHYYYAAKSKASSSADLSWLQHQASKEFKQSHTVVFPLWKR
jgi:hypothetical protein